MKHAFLVSLAAILLTLLLTMLHTDTTAPPQSAVPLTDSIIRFTVKTEEGIVTADMASYLPGVLAGEMPALFESEALKAQAVAARTYILYRMAHGSAAHPEADICNNAACCKAYADPAMLQSRWGKQYDQYLQKITTAVTETDGGYLTYGDSPIEAVFHSSSAGATESSGAIWNDRAYLVSVASPETAADVPDYVSTVDFTPDELRQSLLTADSTLTFSDNPALWISDVTCTNSGRVDRVTVCGQRMSGAALRKALGLRSTAFTVSYDGSFTFTVTGYGHGVGMSQYGANVFAKQGMDYRGILAHYYPNTQLTSAAG